MILAIGLESWAVDLKDVGAIYPLQGYEMPMVWAAVVFWVVWHIWQIRQENVEIRTKTDHADIQRTKLGIDRY